MDREEIVFFIKKAKEKKSRSLDLSNRDLTELPYEIGELTFLEYLDLSYNSITEIPPTIGRLVNLKTLLLLRNKVTQLPPEIGALRELELLDVSHNCFETIPKEIGLLGQLRSFDASYGSVKVLPVELINLLSLKELYLEENPFEFPPYKVVKRGLYATMHYLTSEKKKIDAAKVMLQVFNLPKQLQQPFKEYLSYFNELVSNANKKEILFDVKFIKQEDLTTDFEISVGVENYLYDFMSFIKAKIADTQEVKEMDRSSLVNLQMAELRKQIGDFNESLDSKMKDIQDIQQKMNAFLKNIGDR